MEFVPLVAMTLLLKKLGDFIKQVTNRDVNGALTQLAFWGVAIVVVALVAQTDFADGFSVGDQSLASLNFYSLVFVGMFVGSGGGAFHDWLQARDNTNENSVAKLKLLPRVAARQAKRVA